MFAQVTRLQYWKSEHNETTSEDACKVDSLRGLFAIADGAGTALFSDLWAEILVEQFVSLPLLSSDPFEVEWWIRQAQESYRERISQTNLLSWNAQQKALNEGSFATLATLRMSETHRSSAKGEILVIGDSCIFVESAQTGHVQSFPLTQVHDFDLSPLCFPTRPSLFDRYFHRCSPWQLDLASGDTIVLATDAVARWIISAGQGHHATMADALHVIMAQTPLTWEQFILDCRNHQEMIDDDSTALIISFSEHTQNLGSYLLLGATTKHIKAQRQQRNAIFEQAMRTGNKELMAIYYGDGAMLALEGMVLMPPARQQAHQVADALHEVLAALREVLNNSDAVTRISPVWQKHASVLALEPCAEPLRQTLIRLGASLIVMPEIADFPTAIIDMKPMAPTEDDNSDDAQVNFVNL